MLARHCGTFLVYLWPMPCTMLGLLIAFTPGIGARHFFVHRGTIGVYGPGPRRFLSWIPIPGGAAAITFGHAILAGNRETFFATFDHEMVHVRQYQWWGPLFMPAYVLNSLWHWFRGGDAYYDNHFEQHARRWEDP